jgi:adenine-specific DNA-methyltransferase
MSEGLDENVEFFELVFLDRDEANLGRGFGAIAPLLYLKSGSLGSAISELTSPWALTEDGPYGILFDPEHWRPFVDAIQGRQDVTHAFVVTESLAVFQRVVQELPPNIDTSMLYEDYITSFEINSGADR